MKKKDKIIYSCYYCDLNTDIKIDCDRHVVLKHPRRLAYPRVASITEEGLIPQGKPW